MEKAEHYYTTSLSQTISEDAARKFEQTLSQKTLSYKYYWLMALVEKVAVEFENEFPALDVAIQMSSMAWQPVCKHQIGLGYKDGFKDILHNLRPILNLQPESSRTSVSWAVQCALADSTQSKFVRTQLSRLLKYVPYRFVKPWLLVDADKAEQAVRSNPQTAIAADAPYQLEWRTTNRGRELFVVMHPLWIQYFRDNTVQLIDSALSYLSQYVQNNNRDLLSAEYFLDWRLDAELRQHQLYFWNSAVNGAAASGQPLRCILTDGQLMPQHFRLEHTMPSDYTDANRVWSIFPARLEAQIPQTGNHFSHIGTLLHDLADTQQRALRCFLSAHGSVDAIKCDYVDWDYTIPQLAQMPPTDYFSVFYNHFHISIEQEINLRMGLRSPKVADDSSVGIKISKNYGTIFGDVFNNK